jgi:hypothetical protein
MIRVGVGGIEGSCVGEFRQVLDQLALRGSEVMLTTSWPVL